MSKRLKYLILILILGGCAAVAVIKFSPEARKVRLQERARSYFEAGEYEKSKIEYLNILRRDSSNVEALSRLGLIWLEQGVPLRAIAFLLKSKQLAPDNILLRNKLGVSLLSLGDVAGARKEALAMLAAAPDNGEALVLLADTSGTPDEKASTRLHLEKFPAQDSVSFHLATASLLIREGDMASAEKAAEKALAADPGSATACLAVAAFRLMAKNIPEAEVKFQKGSELAPLRSPQRLKYTEFKLQQGATAEAKELAAGIVRQAPDYLPARILLAQINAAAKDYDGAMSALQDVLRLDAGNYTAGMLQARLWTQKAETRKAVDVLERLQKLYPKHPAVRLELARAYVQDGTPARAAELLDQLSVDYPDLVEAILLRAELNLKEGRAGAAVPALVDLLKKRPQLVQASILLCSSYQALNRVNDAIAVARDLASGAPSNPRFHFLLGETLLQGRFFEESKTAFERVLELTPDNISAVSRLVDLDRAQKHGEIALQRIETFLKLKPDSAEAHFIKSKILLDQKNLDAAEAELAKAIELDANFAPAYEPLIGIYVAGNKIPEALQRLEDLLLKRPQDERALMTLAVLHEQRKDYVKAREAYEKLLAVHPETISALNNLAVLYSVHFNELDKAHEVARKARALRPAADANSSKEGEAASDGEKVASVADTLGWILHLRGQYAEAVTLLQEAAGVLKTNPEVQFHLGMAAYMMGQTDTARTALQAAVSAPGDFRGKPEAQARLALMQGLESGKDIGAQIKNLETLLQSNPADSTLQSQLGEALEKQGNWAKAAAAYEQAIKQNPALTLIMAKLARIYAGPLSNKTKALELGRKAREQAPDNPQIAGIFGEVIFQSGDHLRAYNLLRESARGVKNDPVTLRSLAWAAYSLGKVSEARETMQSLLAAAPDSPEAPAAKSFLAATAPDDPAAGSPVISVSAEALLQKDPGYVPALMLRAAAQSQGSNPASAIATYNAVLSKFPEFTPAQKRLAALYSADPAHYVKSYELAQKARKSLPDDSELAQILGELNFHKKDYSYAIQLLEESARKKPLNATGLYYLGMSRFRKGNREASVEPLTQSISAGLSGPLLEEAQRALKEIREPEENKPPAQK